MYWTQIDERMAGDVVIIDLRGRLTVSEESRPVADTVRRLLREGQTRIIVNLTHVTFIDSLGVGDIVRAYTAALRAGGALRLCGVNSRVRAVLVATQLVSVLTSFETEQLALESFRGSD